jgi:hypothetical protein
MNFLNKLFGVQPGSRRKKTYTFKVKCKRCGEIIEGRVDVENDLSVEYESGGEVFYCRKILMGDGSKHCYQQVEVGLKFGANRELLERRVESGGDFVED